MSSTDTGTTPRTEEQTAQCLLYSSEPRGDQSQGEQITGLGRERHGLSCYEMVASRTRRTSSMESPSKTKRALPG